MLEGQRREALALAEAGQRGDQVGIDRPSHRIARRKVAITAGRTLERHLPGGVRRTEHQLLGRGLVAVELEPQLLALAAEPQHAPLQPDPILLESVAEAGLGDPPTLLELR